MSIPQPWQESLTSCYQSAMNLIYSNCVCVVPLYPSIQHKWNGVLTCDHLQSYSIFDYHIESDCDSCSGEYDHKALVEQNSHDSSTVRWCDSIPRASFLRSWGFAADWWLTLWRSCGNFKWWRGISTFAWASRSAPWRCCATTYSQRGLTSAVFPEATQNTFMEKQDHCVTSATRVVDACRCRCYFFCKWINRWIQMEFWIQQRSDGAPSSSAVRLVRAWRALL